MATFRINVSLRRAAGSPVISGTNPAARHRITLPVQEL
jgi:hypothetical protein